MADATITVNLLHVDEVTGCIEVLRDALHKIARSSGEADTRYDAIAAIEKADALLGGVEAGNPAVSEGN